MHDCIQSVVSTLQCDLGVVVMISSKKVSEQNNSFVS